MYEGEQGARHLAITMYHRLDDEAAMQRLAYVLHYEPQQLKEDVQALYDFRTAEKQVSSLFPLCSETV